MIYPPSMSCLTRALAPAAAAVAVLLAVPVSAQSLGSFRWQLQPFCNVVTVNVTQQGGLFTIDGYDDQCGAGQRGPLVGMATQNPDGTIGFGLHIVTVPGGRAVDVDARIDLGTLSGPWSDSAGNSGAFTFNGGAGGLPPRPLPTIPSAALAPASITSAHLAPAAVGTANIADGSITPEKLSAALPRLASSGLTTGVLLLDPAGASVVVRTVTLSVPAAGQVLANASGLFGFTLGTFNQRGWCSITTGTTVETAHYLYSRVDAAFSGYNVIQNVPFGGSRVYDVTPGSFTLNLACTGFSNVAQNPPTLQTAQLSALFIPN